MKVGDKFKKVYPFILIKIPGDELIKSSEFWKSGCTKTFEQYSPYHGETFYNADAEGLIEYEVLAIVDMPRKYQQRVIYRLTFIDPELNAKKSHEAHTATRTKFDSWINARHSPYYYDYEIND